MELLRDVSAILVPIILAVFGWLINRSIQKQNRVADRNTHLARQWADEFSAIAKNIADTTTTLFFGYWKIHFLNQSGRSVEADTFVKEEFNEYILKAALELYRLGWELNRFTHLAPKSGPSVKAAWEKLDECVRVWIQSKGGSVELYRQLQLEFDVSSRKMHAELLALES